MEIGIHFSMEIYLPNLNDISNVVSKLYSNC